MLLYLNPLRLEEKWWELGDQNWDFSGILEYANMHVTAWVPSGKIETIATRNANTKR